MERVLCLRLSSFSRSLFYHFVFQSNMTTIFCGEIAGIPRPVILIFIHIPEKLTRIYRLTVHGYFQAQSDPENGGWDRCVDAPTVVEESL